MGLANLCQLGRLLHGAGIPVMLLGQDAMRVHYAPDLARIMHQHDIAVAPEQFAQAERLMAANGYLRIAGGAGFSSWTILVRAAWISAAWGAIRSSSTASSSSSGAPSLRTLFRWVRKRL